MIENIDEPWRGHKYSEVEDFIKETFDTKYDKACNAVVGQIPVFGDNETLVTSGYKPSDFGSEQKQSDWAQTDTSSPTYIKNKPNFSAVATTGNYNDLNHKPSNISEFNNDSGYITSSALTPIVNVIPETASQQNKLADKAYVDGGLAAKEDTLRSGETIKTINGLSVLGSGNIYIPKGDDGMDAVNPFKGWFDSLPQLQQLYPTPSAGDFAYVMDNNDPHVSARVYNSPNGGSWSNSGMDVDDPNNITFATGEELNEVRIDGSGLTNIPQGVTTLPKAMDVMSIKAKLTGITAEESGVYGSDVEDWHPVGNTSGRYRTTTNQGIEWSESEVFKSTRINCAGFTRVRFLGFSAINSTSCYVFTNYQDEIVDYGIYHIDGQSGVVKQIEYNVAVPDGAYYLICLYQAYGVSNLTYDYFQKDDFYCYLQIGDTVMDKINEISNSGVFKTGEHVSDVSINRSNMNVNDEVVLANSYEVSQLKTKLTGITAEEIKCTGFTDYIPSGETLKGRYYLAYNETGAPVWTPSNDYVSTRIDCHGFKKVRFLAASLINSGNFFVFTDEYGELISYHRYYYNSISGSFELTIDVPEGAYWFVCLYRFWGGSPSNQFFREDDFYCYLQIGDTVIDKINELSGSWELDTFYPSWIGGNPVNTSTADYFSFGETVSNAKELIHTRVIKCLYDTKIKIGNVLGKRLIYAFYNNEWMRVGNGSYGFDHGLSSMEFTVPSTAKYFILQGSNKISENNEDIFLRDMDISVTMYVNTNNRYSFCPKPQNQDGYQRLAMLVGYDDMRSSVGPETPTDALLLKTSYDVDYGMLRLPETYTEDGEPTRLIVFTHGHAAHYRGNETIGFDKCDIDSEYWYKEGYAIVDMDGQIQVSGSDVNHEYEPASINSYETAYQWIVRHYNIRTDGVFATGRSMGGGMQFVLAKQSTIPILASAPIVPATFPLGYILKRKNYDDRKSLMSLYGVPSTVLDELSVYQGILPYHNLPSDWQNAIVKYQHLFAPYSPCYCINRPYEKTELILWSEGFYGNYDAETIESKFNELTNSIKNNIDVSRFKNIPFRLYTCVGDTICRYQSVVWMYRVLSMAGYDVQLHVFPQPQNDNGDCSYTTGHRFEINSHNCIDTVITSKGEAVSDVPKVYVEILAFWRKYENQDTVV